METLADNAEVAGFEVSGKKLFDRTVSGSMFGEDGNNGACFFHGFFFLDMAPSR
jgi:hypothetical protein